MSAPPKRYRIGYAFQPKKAQSVVQPSLVDHAALHNVDLIAVHPSKPLADQGPFDCIVHKLYGHDWKLQLQQFSSEHPNVPIIDQPDRIEKLHNRVCMLQVVARLRISAGSESVDLPKQVVVSKPEDLNASGLVGELGFPLIAKPLLANGTAKSHQMYLVFDRDGLEKVHPPIVLQEFVNHGGVLFKVYVAGRHVRCVKRKSLPDIPAEKLATLKGSLPFSKISNLAVEEYDADSCTVEMPSMGFVEEIARELKEEMGINLFNFDLIRDGRDGKRYLVIDINYFPGYAKMPNYEPMLTDFFLDVLHEETTNMADEGKINN